MNHSLKFILILSALFFVLPLISASDLSSCSPVIENSNLIADVFLPLNQSSCFEIQASNIILDCNGHTIFGHKEFDTTSITTQNENIAGWKLKNCVIENFTGALIPRGSDVYVENTTVLNNFFGIAAVSILSPNLYLQNISTFNNSVVGIGSSANITIANWTSVLDYQALIIGSGVKVQVINFTILNVTIVGSGEDAAITNCDSDLLLVNGSITTTSDTQSEIATLCGESGIIHILNTTLNRSKIFAGGFSNVIPTIYRQWYLRANVTDANGLPQNNVVVNIRNVSGAIYSTVVTDSNGLTEWTIQNDTKYLQSGPSAFNESPYFITASNGTHQKTVSTQLIESKTVNLQLKPISCGQLYASAKLSSNLFSNSTCLSIAVPKITVDCNGFNITGASVGYGIYNPGYDAVNIINCNFKNFSVGASIQGGLAHSSDADTIGLWHLDDPGTSVLDSSSNNNNGTVVGAVSHSFGRFITSFTFNGTGDYIEVPDSNSLDITGPITIEAWILRERNSGGIETIVAKWAPSTNQRSYQLGINAADRLFFRVSRLGGSVSATATAVSTIALGEWHHVAGIYNGSFVKIFVDGVEEDAVPYAQTIFASTTPLRFGSESDGGRFFGGKIDEVRILNRSITDFFIPSSLTSNILSNNTISDSRRFGIQISSSNNNSVFDNAVLGITNISGSGIIIRQSSNNMLIGTNLLPGEQRNSFIMSANSTGNVLADAPMCLL